MRTTRLKSVVALVATAVIASTAYAAGAGVTGASARAGSDARTLVAEAKAADSHCVTVVRDGKVLLSRDLAKKVDTTIAWSITKSVTSLLVGIAQDKKMLKLDDRVARYVPQWRGTASKRVTIRHLLANTSGREWDARTDYQVMIAARNKTRFGIRLDQQHRPGTTWAYNNSAIQVLEAVLEKATKRPVADFAQATLFGPLRMRNTSIETDVVGNPMLFGGMRSTCPDLARLGVMLADQGRYDGRRIVSRRYVREATQRPSSELNTAYGLLFWINEPGPVLSPLPPPAGTPTAQGPMVPTAPEDAYWALGLNQQILHVSPTEKIVAVRLGDPPPADGPLTIDRFTDLARAVAGAS
ncbi:serine hydrolase domain-containing protein [Nocardioides campestrisoli]|uniref:serine hydrolase domain-containing protein n=1 Tax=Nocardioides campestrisoli TaxID=2736757 RepID=UPI00163DB3F3|nr:serine hydrolase [Nocardioides campestrisoli]